MDAGLPGFEAGVTLGRRAAFAWMLIILGETVHGAIRVYFIAPHIGDLRSRQIGVFVGSAIVFAIAWLTVRWIGAATRRACLSVGLFWVALTVMFEIALGRAMGASWDRIFSDFNPARGGLMLLGLAFMAVAPLLAARKR